MKSGSVNQPNQNVVKRKPAPGAEAAKTKVESKEVEQSAGSATPEVAEPTEKILFGTVLNVSPELLKTTRKPDGSYDTDKTLAWVDKSDRTKLEAQGVVYVEGEDVLSAKLGDAVGPEGSLDVTPLYDTNNPNTVQVGKGIEVPKELLEIDPETQAPVHENFVPTLLAQGEGILPVGQKAVPGGATVIPEGFVGQLGRSEGGGKVEGARVLANNSLKIFGTLSGSALLGVMKLPYVTPMAPWLAVGTAGFTVNHSLEALRDAKDKTALLDQQVKKSPTDLVAMQNAQGQKYHVSETDERSRLQSQVRQAYLSLGSTGLLAASGGLTLAGAMGAGAAGGLMGLAVAGAPALAGGALLLGNGAMVFDSIQTLKKLSKEKTELLALQEKGETHVDRVLEMQNPNLKTITAVGNEMASVPIGERLKEIKTLRADTMRRTALITGGAAGMVATAVGAPAIVSMGAISPFALLWAGNKVGQSLEARAENKELKSLASQGQTMVSRDAKQVNIRPEALQALKLQVSAEAEAEGIALEPAELDKLASERATQDMLEVSWESQKVPISQLVAENSKAIKKNVAQLTAAGSLATGVTIGMTLGAGMALTAAAPLVLLPAVVGGILFPDKVAAFGQKVSDIVGGLVGESGQTRRATEKTTENLADKFAEKMNDKWSGYRETNPNLFADRPKKIPFTKIKYGGYFTEMNRLAKDYATASTPQERQHFLQEIQNAVSNEDAPDFLKPELKMFMKEFEDLKMDVEAQWLARDIVLEMKTPLTEKVVNDDRVKARLTELEFPLDNIKEQYAEALDVLGTPQKAEALLTESRNGNRDASRKLFATEVFSAAKGLHQTEQTLGLDLYTRYVDALQQEENAENFELLMKEVAYKQNAQVSEEQNQILANNYRTLHTPLQLAPESPDAHVLKLRGAIEQMKQANPELAEKLLETDAKISNPETFQGMTAQEALAQRTKLNAVFQSARRGLKTEAPEALKTWQEADSKLKTLASAEPVEATPPPTVLLAGPEARMENAFRSLSQAQPSLAKELGDAFAVLNAPATEGTGVQEVQQNKIDATQRLSKVRQKLEKKEPTLMKVWDKARVDVETAYFERSVDQDVKKHVLSQTAVTDAAKELGVSAEETEGLYMGLMRAQVLHDHRELETRLANEAGDGVDDKKAQLLNILDRTLVKTAAEMTAGAADDVPDGPVAPQQDPNVQRYLQQSPEIVAALNSPEFGALAGQMKLAPEQVIGAFLSLVQVQSNPALLAEFQGRLEAGDIQAVNTQAIGQAVNQFVMEKTRPSPEQLSTMVEQSMAGPVVQTALQDPQIKAHGESLGIDVDKTTRLYLNAELGKNPALIVELETKAQKGDTEAQKQLSFLQAFIPTVGAVTQQLASGNLPLAS